MIRFLISLSLICLHPSLHATSTCPNALGPADGFAKLIPLLTGHTLFVRFERPKTPPKGFFVLVHGLLQDETSFDSLAALLIAKGYAVIRPDLYGFGRSFDPAGGTGTIYYQANVADLGALILLLRDEYGVNNPHLVGHSMGGGLLAALVQNPDLRKLVAAPVTLLAPYVYRLEFYLADKATGMSFFDSSPSLRMFDQLPFFMRFGSESFLNAVSEPQLRLMFHSFLKHEEPVDHRKLRVNAAIATVRGLRELNTFDCLDKIPDDFGLRLVLGKHDVVVDARLERKLGGAIRRKSGEFIELNAGHMMLEEVPEQLAQILLKTN